MTIFTFRLKLISIFYFVCANSLKICIFKNLHNVKNLHDFLTRVDLSVFLLLQGTLFINCTKAGEMFCLFKYVFTLMIQRDREWILKCSTCRCTCSTLWIFVNCTHNVCKLYAHTLTTLTWNSLIINLKFSITSTTFLFSGLHELLKDRLSEGLSSHNPKHCIVCNPDASHSSSDLENGEDFHRSGKVKNYSQTP